MKYPLLRPPATARLMTDTFRGYMRKLKTPDGAFYDTEGLSSDHYPMLSSRPARGLVKTLSAPGGLIEKDALGLIEKGTLYYNGLETPLTGISPGEKQLVSMGAYICIFPDKLYFNTADHSDYGSMEAHYESLGDVQYRLCRADGTEYDSAPTLSDTEPENAFNLQLWIDIGSGILYQYSASLETWTELPTVYTKLVFTSLGQIPALFSPLDAVEVSGTEPEGFEGSHIIHALGGSETEADYIVVTGLIPGDYTQSAGSVKISRTLPALDFVCECQNRLWGCYYGNDGERNLNEIYCSALGDFKNWRRYMGISSDSWSASVGSDGQWTGAVNYLGRPCFFKENRIHAVTVSATGAHRISETVCRGVQKGSHKSLAVINETLFYKSCDDVCAWQGGFPDSVSEALGREQYSNAAAGALGQKYYLSMEDREGRHQLFVYDIERGIWLREGEFHALCFARMDSELYAIEADTPALIAMCGSQGEREESVSWMCESGIMGYEYPDNKYLSRYNFRLMLDSGGSMEVYLRYDSAGDWIHSGSIRGSGCGSVTLPIRPRRCDHLQLRLVGQGRLRLYSIARILEVGSDE